MILKIFVPKKLPFEKSWQKNAYSRTIRFEIVLLFFLKKHQLFIILRGIAGIWFSDQQFNGSERVAW